ALSFVTHPKRQARMSFRNSNDRRRRVLAEDLSSAGDVSATSVPKAVRKVERYTEAAQMDQQPRVTDFVPTRFGIFALLIAANLAVIAGLEALYAWMPEIGRLAGGSMTFLDVARAGSLAVWFSSAWMALAGLAAI